MMSFRILHLLLPTSFLFPVLMLTALAGVARAADPAPWKASFEDMAALPATWKTTGDVTIETGDAYHEGKSLKLSRTADKAHIPVSAAGPAFPVVPGQWEISVAGKVDIYSPDNSFNGKVVVECLDASGKMITSFPLASFDRQNDWTQASKRVEFPRGSVSARFVLDMSKTYGVFKADSLSAVFRSAGRSETEVVDRILFSTAQMGNLLYPSDPRKIQISVETFKPLSDHGQKIKLDVRDYWGAEQSEPLTAVLQKKVENSYEAVFDLASLPLQTGRYYEMHAGITLPDGKMAGNYSSLAILPEAVTRSYKPEEIPFTSRNWDNRIEEFYPLTDRIGVRVCGIWGRFSSEPPYEAQAQRIDLVKKFEMGALTTTPIHAIEHQSPGWEKYDEKALKEGVKNLIKKIGPIRPLVINLGNEPPGNDQAVIKRAVAAYKIVYQEIKKIDPSIFVLGSSAGPDENFFKEGFGEWCDAYDFHTYEDSKFIRGSLRKYRELFKKYGHDKPVWATEVGLNSQGLERRVVSIDMIKKFTGFFAEGGTNVSWFGIIYPDPELKLTGGSEDCHNVFDCRYKRYAPKLDAITYYYMVNGIGIKKFVAEKTYPDGVYAALFRDRDNKCLQVLWREEGDSDVFVPLPETGKVRVIRIDGKIRELDAGKKGVSVSIGPDPVLLEYEKSTAPLAEKLGASPAVIGEFDRPLVLGASAVLAVAIKDKESVVEVELPPLWKVQKKGTGTFNLQLPASSKVREVNVSVVVKDAAGHVTGDLLRRLPVSGKLSMRVLPEPSLAGKDPGIRLFLTNHSTVSLKATWELALTGEMELKEGKFGLPESPVQKLGGETAGSMTLAAGASGSLVVSLPGADLNKLYRVRASAVEPDGTTVTSERYVGGFVGVHRAVKAPVMDGILDEATWKSAESSVMEKGNHFNPLQKKTASWTDKNDLSAKVRYLWDDKYLYVGVEVKDDKAGGLKQNSAIWSQDGLQFLIDPARESSQKPGKYDYAVAVGSKGPQAWSYLTADPIKAPVNEVKDFVISAKRKDTASGDMTYELAIPWNRVSPFKPGVGANLGLTVILNEDDGLGRDSFMAWFGNAHTKQVDTAGDLVLLP